MKISYKGITIYEGPNIDLDFVANDMKINKEELVVKFSKKEIEQQYQQKMQTLTSSYTEEEQKTWQTQLEEAKAYLVNNTTPIPMLTEMADGTDIQTLAQKVVSKAELLKVESGKLLAWKNRELAKIK